MKRLKLLFMALCLCIIPIALLKAEAVEDNFAHLGKGCTAAYYIDKDCDGYGVGRRSDNSYGMGKVGDMADADDNDPTITDSTSLQQVINDGRYVDLKDFLQRTRGYNPQKMVFISPAGSDTGNGSISGPYKTWSKAQQGNLQPGTVFIFRGGTYPKGSGPSMTAQGTANAPIIAMSYPGESVVFQNGEGGYGFGVGEGSEHIIYDGLTINSGEPSGYAMQSFAMKVNYPNSPPIKHITLRGFESTKSYFEVCTSMYGKIRDILVEECILHDSFAYGNQHGLYFGAVTYQPGDYVFGSGDEEMGLMNITIRNNILYGQASGGNLQLNGPMTNVLVEGNIFHSNTQNAMNIYNGVSNSIIRNNLIFNVPQDAIMIFIYHNTTTLNADGTIKELRANNIHGLQIVNNTIYMPSTGVPIYSNISLSLQPPETPRIHDIDIKNNIIVSGNDMPLLRAKAGTENDLGTWTVENNLFYRINGSQPSCFLNIGAATLCSLAGTTYNRSLAQAEQAYSGFSGNTFANPLFIDTVSNDFQLQQGSSAIDFGKWYEGVPTVDLKENERMGNPDAGCYEYASGAPPAVLYGDVSGNGEISATDASLAAQYAVGSITLTPEQVTRANVSGDDEVSAADASLIAQRAVGLIDKFPVEGG